MRRKVDDLSQTILLCKSSKVPPEKMKAIEELLNECFLLEYN